MATRTGNQRTRGVITEAETAELAEHYARILEPPADSRVSTVIRTCLRRLPSRLPIPGRDRRAVEALIERVLQLGKVGSPDLVGSPREIDIDIASRLGEAAGDPRDIYRALRGLLGHTVLVKRHSRQTWVLRLSGLTDPASEVHRALLAETPALYCLPTPDPDTAQPAGPSAVDSANALHTELVRLRGELAAECVARAEAEQRSEVTEAELVAVRRTLDEERQARVVAAREQRAEMEAIRDMLGQELEASRLRERELANALASARQELDGLREAQEAEAAALQQFLEARQVPEAAALIVARMFGLEFDDAAQALQALTEPGAAQKPNPAVPGTSTLAIAAEPASKSNEPPPQPDRPTHTGTSSPVAAVEASSPAPETVPPTHRPEPPPPPWRPARAERPLTSQAPVLAVAQVLRDQQRQEPHLNTNKVGRNAPCPCGSGKKFKRCCGSLAE